MVSQNLNDSTLMCAGKFSPVFGSISWDGDIDEVFCKCTTGVCVRIARFEIVNERQAN